MNLLSGKDDQEVDISYLYEDELLSSQATSDCSSSSSSSNTLDATPESPYSRQQSRRSLRKSLTHALISPVKIARNSMNYPTTSPNKCSPSKKKMKVKGSSSKTLLSTKDDFKTWQERFDLPPNTTREQAMAVLLCRELEMIDIWPWNCSTVAVCRYHTRNIQYCNILIDPILS